MIILTAVVGILNKQAVAIAADSAVTIGGNGGRKIFNKANKVFTLSKQHPVGVMIYNSATLMTTPWETIIKVYRKKLGEKSFGTVLEYQKDFLNFLKAHNFYTDASMQLVFLENLASNIIDSVIQIVARNHSKLLENPTPENQAAILIEIEKQFDGIIDFWNQTNEYCPEFADYNFDDFVNYSNQTFITLVDKKFTINGITLSDPQLSKIKQAVFAVLRAKEIQTSYTGLIFTGFGEDEIYPQLIPLNISMVIDNRLRYYVDENNVAKISNSNNAAIMPFAQTDVIDTILSGIDPSLDNTYLHNFNSIFQKYNQAILDSIGDTNPLLTEQIKNLNTEVILQELNGLNQQIRQTNYIRPLMNAVGSLAKEDLAEMAESLIYLTYLKRRITFAEESVGGPVDVAIISKGDGFVWIKRKHYFRPELNQHFFENYFKK